MGVGGGGGVIGYGRVMNGEEGKVGVVGGDEGWRVGSKG